MPSTRTSPRKSAFCSPICAVLAGARQPLTQKQVRNTVRMRTSDVSQALATLIANGRVLKSADGINSSADLHRFRFPFPIGSKGYGNGKHLLVHCILVRGCDLYTGPIIPTGQGRLARLSAGGSTAGSLAAPRSIGRLRRLLPPSPPEPPLARAAWQGCGPRSRVAASGATALRASHPDCRATAAHRPLGALDRMRPAGPCHAPTTEERGGGRPARAPASTAAIRHKIKPGLAHQ